MQRDRDASHYLDVAAFERRPSLWIEPIGPWPDGAIELVEIPSQVEYEDNIVAFFRPSAPSRKVSSYKLRYCMRWIAEDVHLGDLARCTATRLARPIREVKAGGEPTKTRRWLVVEWVGEALGDIAGLRPAIYLSRGTLGEVEMEESPSQTNAVRVRFEIVSLGSEPLDLHIVLKRDERTISETWRYTLDPDRGAISSFEVNGVTTLVE